MSGHQAAVWSGGGGSATAHLVRGAWTLCGRPGAPLGPITNGAVPRCLLCAAVGPQRYTVGELAGLGLTVRQIHHWCDRGWLICQFTGAGARVFGYPEYAVARRAVALLHAGYRTDRALEVARRTVDPVD